MVLVFSMEAGDKQGRKVPVFEESRPAGEWAHAQMTTVIFKFAEDAFMKIGKGTWWFFYKGRS